MFTDFVMNGQGHGTVGELLQGVRFDPGLLRPYFNEQGRRCCTVNTGRMKRDDKTGQYAPVRKEMTFEEMAYHGLSCPVANATSLRKDQWIQVDRSVLMAYRERLRAWADLASVNTYSGFNGMGKLTLEYQVMSDGGEAFVDMDVLTQDRRERPLFLLRSLPLPIIHSGGWYSARELAVSRNEGTPHDTISIEQSARRVGEMVEDLLIGTVTGITFGTNTNEHDGTSTVYGYTNYPQRMTKTDLTVPTGSNPEATVSDVLEMLAQMRDNRFYGPFMLYHSTDWDAYLDNDYARLGGTNANLTLRDRIRAIDGIMDVRRLDRLTSDNNPFTFILVQLTSEVARAVIGMPITTIQWDTRGGMQQNFRVMCIHVPQFRHDYNDRAGILHATTS